MIISLVLVLVLFLAVVFVSHMKRFIISDIQIVGNSVTTDDKLKQIVQEDLAGKYFWLFPKANAAIFPRQALAANIFSEIPRIQDVNIELLNPVTLQVSVKERKPYALYCKQAVDDLSAENCFFIDEEGFIFSEAPLFSGAVYFIYTSNRIFGEPLGQYFLPKKDFMEVANFVENVEDLGVEGRRLELSDGVFHLFLSSSGEIIWNKEDPASLVWQNLNAFLSDKEIASQPDFLEKISYIDLRFKNKVFYKFQEQAVEE